MRAIAFQEKRVPMKRQLSLCSSAIFILCSLAFGRASSQPNFWQLTNDTVRDPISKLAFNASGDIFIGTGWCCLICSGELYRSTNDGGAWEQLNLAGYIGGLAINSSGCIFTSWWANVRPRNVRGISRSSDNGNTWMQSDSSYNTWAALAIGPTGTIFAGNADPGGVFRSTDDGLSWSEPDTNFKASVQALAINASGHIFVGGSGIFRSTDNGNSWIHLGFSETSWVMALAINSFGHIFAGTNAGRVLQSTDNGGTWERILSTPSSITSMIPNSEDDLFIATFGSGVYRNGMQINSGLTDTSVTALAINPAGFLFAGTESGLVFRSVQSTTGVDGIPGEMPHSFGLSQNYPNPFNPSTTIRYALPHTSFVTVTVYNTLGQQVAQLVKENQQAGYHEAVFRGDGLASGVYFYRLFAGDYTSVKRLLLLK